MVEGLTDEEIVKLRVLLASVNFEKKREEEEKPRGPDGGDVLITPGHPWEGTSGTHGRIVLCNPGGTTRPFMKIRLGNIEKFREDLDVYVGTTEDSWPVGEISEGSVYLRFGGWAGLEVLVKRDGAWCGMGGGQ